jgi:hypothetical protein
MIRQEHTIGKQSAGDFLACGLCKESGARKSACRSSRIDLINERFIKRNIYSNSSASISKERNGKQDSPSFERYLYFSISHNLVYASCCRQSSACAFNRFDMLTQRSSCIANGLFQRVTCGKTSLHIRKPDAKSAVYVLLHHSHVARRHRFKSSGPPAGQFVDVPHQSDRQISSRMGDRDDHIAIRMFIRVVIAIDPIKHPRSSMRISLRLFLSMLLSRNTAWPYQCGFREKANLCV